MHKQMNLMSKPLCSLLLVAPMGLSAAQGEVCVGHNTPMGPVHLKAEGTKSSALGKSKILTGPSEPLAQAEAASVELSTASPTTGRTRPSVHFGPLLPDRQHVHQAGLDGFDWTVSGLYRTPSAYLFLEQHVMPYVILPEDVLSETLLSFSSGLGVRRKVSQDFWVGLSGSLDYGCGFCLCLPRSSIKLRPSITLEGHWAQWAASFRYAGFQPDCFSRLGESFFPKSYVPSHGAECLLGYKNFIQVESGYSTRFASLNESGSSKEEPQHFMQLKFPELTSFIPGVKWLSQRIRIGLGIRKCLQPLFGEGRFSDILKGAFTTEWFQHNGLNGFLEIGVGLWRPSSALKMSRNGFTKLAPVFRNFGLGGEDRSSFFL